MLSYFSTMKTYTANIAGNQFIFVVVMLHFLVIPECFWRWIDFPAVFLLADILRSLNSMRRIFVLLQTPSILQNLHQKISSNLNFPIRKSSYSVNGFASFKRTAQFCVSVNFHVNLHVFLRFKVFRTKSTVWKC